MLNNNKKEIFFIITIIVLIGLFLRIFYIKQYLPTHIFIDERINVKTALNIGMKSLNPKTFFDGGVFFYCLFILFKVLNVSYSLLSKILLVCGMKGFPHLPFDIINNHVFIARIFVSILGVISILVLYFLVKERLDYKVALISAFFLSVCPLHIALSHVVISYVVVTFFILLAMLFILRIANSDAIKLYDFLAAGIFIGLATGTKYFGIFLFIPLFIAHVRGSNIMYPNHMRNRYLFYAIITSVAVFLFFNPYLILDIKNSLRDLKEIYNTAINSFPYAVLASRRGWIGYPLSLAYGLGYGIYIFSLGGIVLSLLKHTKNDILIISFPAAFYFILGYLKYSFIRFLLPITPFLIIFAAKFVLFLSTIIIKNNESFKKKETSILLGLCLFFALPSIYEDLYYAKWISQEPTEYIAERWCYKNIDRGSSILIDSIGNPNTDFIFKKNSDYDIKTIDWTNSADPVVFFKNNYFDYIIIDASREKPKKMEPFYSYIDNNFILFQEIRPAIASPKYISDSLYSSSGTTCNPVIKIYIPSS